MSDEARKLSPEEKRQMKSAARLYAVQALFQMEAAGQSVDAVRREFETHRFGAVIEGEESIFSFFSAVPAVQFIDEMNSKKRSIKKQKKSNKKLKENHT